MLATQMDESLKKSNKNHKNKMNKTFITQTVIILADSAVLQVEPMVDSNDMGEVMMVLRLDVIKWVVISQLVTY